MFVWYFRYAEHGESNQCRYEKSGMILRHHIIMNLTGNQTHGTVWYVIAIHNLNSLAP